MMLGRTEIEFVADTEVRGRSADYFPGRGWDVGEIVARVGSFLIRTPERIVLVDLGLGPGGALLGNLARRGVTPADVDVVFFTHRHRDHIGWAGAFPDARETLPPGLEVVPSPGHTPDHACLLVTDPGTTERVLLLGDLLHHPVQFDHPDWTFRSDADPAQAVRSRREVLSAYADGRTTLVAAHF